MALGLPREWSWLLKAAEDFVVTCLKHLGFRSAASILRILKILCIQTPAEAPVVLRRCGVLHHTGQQVLLLERNLQPALYCCLWSLVLRYIAQKTFGGLLPPRSRTILQFSAWRLRVGIGDLLHSLPTSKPSSISPFV